MSDEPVFYPRRMGDDPPSPTSNSAPSTRRNSVDLDLSSFSAGFSHRHFPSRPTPTQHARMYIPSEQISPRLDSTRPLLAHSTAMANLQSAGGGTAALTPDLAAQLTEAQIQLSMRKKQPDTIPPIGYICRLCAIEGHWMENCILYRSNRHPQYNNAARAVALNIISPDSQIILNSLSVVPKPKQLYTPKFVSHENMRQVPAQGGQQSGRRSEYVAKTGDYHSQQMLRSTLPNSYPANNSGSQEEIPPSNFPFCYPQPSLSPRSGSRFEQIWKS
ncbi:hypothetical protein HDU83_001894 [Entophlyctis luteolus]|nr:hypothetical protein HDU83_001894 [Entophlyctis luteolus]